MTGKDPGADAQHINKLEDNLEDVEDLLLMHHHIRDEKECSHDVSILHRSAVVLLSACWEAFIEDLASNSLTYMIDAISPMSLPLHVREIVGKQHPGIEAWKLAGDGWRHQMRGHLKGVLAQTLDRHHSPKTKKIDELFRNVTGIQTLSAHWKWRGMTAGRAQKRIDEMVETRGGIAHRVRSATRVNRAYVEKHARLVRNLACSSSNAMARYIKGLAGAVPWEVYRVGEVDD